MLSSCAEKPQYPPNCQCTLPPHTCRPKFMFPFLVPQAFDDDAPNTPNSLVIYSISFADTTPSTLLFTIDSSNGQISSSALNYEAVPSHMYSLLVYVTDSGTQNNPPNTCSVIVNIRVSDIALSVWACAALCSIASACYVACNIILEFKVCAPHVRTPNSFSLSSDTASFNYSCLYHWRTLILSDCA